MLGKFTRKVTGLLLFIIANSTFLLRISYPSFLLTALRKQHAHKAHGEERTYSMFSSQELTQGHGRVLLTDLLLRACSFWFLMAHRVTRPGIKPPTMAWALPHKSLIKKMPYRIVFSLSDGGVFSIRFLYEDNPSLCQANGQLIRTKSTQNFYFFLVSLSVHSMHVHECDCVYECCCLWTASVTAPEEKCSNLSGCQVIPKSVTTLEKRVS